MALADFDELGFEGAGVDLGEVDAFPVGDDEAGKDLLSFDGLFFVEVAEGAGVLFEASNFEF